jgi:hypothetical protein
MFFKRQRKIDTLNRPAMKSQAKIKEKKKEIWFSALILQVVRRQGKR